MRGRPRYYVEPQGPNAEAVKLGLAWLANGAARSGAAEAIIAMPTKANVEGSVVTEVIGRQAARNLSANRRVLLKTDATQVPLRLITERTRLCLQRPTPVLCLYVSKAFLDKLDADPDVSEMCVVPWADEARQWIETWQPDELTGKGAVSPPAALDPILEEALRSLTGRVNLATGVSHPSDRAAAIDMFRRLWRNQIPFDPEAVRRWLIAEGGWQPRHADRVKEIAEGVLGGRRFQRVRPSWARNIVQQWKRRAAERERS